MKRKIIAFFCLNLLLLCLTAFADENALCGGGTQDNPYLVADSDQFLTMAQLINTGDKHYTTAFYRLEANIDLSGKSCPVICPNSESPFCGCFDGNGFSVVGAQIEGTTEYTGLFGVADGAVFKNLELSGIKINVSADTGVLNVGALCGYFVNTRAVGNAGFFGVQMTGSVTATGTNTCGGFVGGLVGNCVVQTGFVSISDCVVGANVGMTAGRSVWLGGIVGRIVNSDKNLFESFLISSCVTYGKASANSSGYYPVYVGGIAGGMRQDAFGTRKIISVEDSISAMELYADIRSSGQDNVGRVCANSLADASINNCRYASMDGTTVPSDGAALNGEGITLDLLGSEEFLKQEMNWNTGSVWHINKMAEIPELAIFSQMVYLSQNNGEKCSVTLDVSGTLSCLAVLTVCDGENRVSKVILADYFAYENKAFEISLENSENRVVNGFLLSDRQSLRPLCKACILPLK